MKISTHTPLARRDLEKCVELRRAEFLLTRPMRGATYYSGAARNVPENFYSHASCEARHASLTLFFFPNTFLLTRPMRGATADHTNEYAADRFLLTRPMRGATCTHLQHKMGKYFYSHAPCGARQTRSMTVKGDDGISTHTPHAGRDAASFG